MFKGKGSFAPVDNEFDFSESDFESDFNLPTIQTLVFIIHRL